MDIVPKLTATQFSQLASGDLFMCPDDTGLGIAIVVTDTTADDDKLALLLRPSDKRSTYSPALIGFPSDSPVISFGKDYLLRLPCDTKGWLVTEPSINSPSLLLQNNDLYLRGFFGAYGQQLTPCYVNIQDGKTLVRSGGFQRGFAHPGRGAYAVEWSLWTTDAKPREILSFPPPNSIETSK
jgi:hypothetical protein